MKIVSEAKEYLLKDENFPGVVVFAVCVVMMATFFVFFQ